MGGEQSQETKTEIINDTRVQTAMSNMNKSISETAMSMVQESLKQTAAGAEIKQEVTISGLKAKGDIIIGEISQKADVEISVSSLTNSELKQELVQSTMNDMQTKLKEQMSMSQEQAETEGEQMVAELASALSETMQSLGASVTGTDTSSKSETSIQNLLNIESSVELQNIVESAVTVDLVNKTVESIASNVVGEQKTEISNLESTDGSIVIAGVDQEVLSKQMLEAITSVGMGSEIMASVSQVSKAEVDKSIEAGQTVTQETVGTIDAAGTFVEQAVGAWSGLMSTMGLTILIPILIVGGLVLFMFRGTISKVAEQQAGIPQQQYPQQQFYQGGGGKALKTGMKKAQSMLKNITKTMKKYATRKNLVLLVIAVLLSLVIYKLYKMISSKTLEEQFTNESKMAGVMISSKGKYLKNKKLGDNHLCLNKDKSKAFKFNVSKNDADKTVTIHRAGKGKKLYIKLQDNDIVLAEFKSAHQKKYDFSFTKKGENTYTFSQGKKHLALKNGCLTVVPKKEDATELKFE